jgi:hypothetical protein
MFATFATYASPRLNQPPVLGAATARAIAPAPVAPQTNERPRPAPMSAANVALSTAAMAALIQAQEHMGSDATELDREHMADKIDRLISQLDDGDPPPPPTSDTAFTVRRLEAARERLL